LDFFRKPLTFITMKKILTLITLCLLAVAPIMADDEDKKDDGVELYAVATLSSGDKDVYLGDSVIVTLTLYSNVQFAQIENKSDKAPTIKNSTVHYYNKNRRLSQGTGVYKDKRYYAVVAQQFAVTPDELGNYTFPAQKFNVQLNVQVRGRGYDPFEDFFSFGSPFGGRTEKIQKTCASEPIKFKAVKRPPKTIKDLQQSGTVVM